MDIRIQELIDLTKEKFGLDPYYLGRSQIYRMINIFNETVYTLCMEWFPNHVTEQEEDGSNPEGTAVIEINMGNRKFERAIFVMGKTYVTNGITFDKPHKNEIIKWVEQETGLSYGEQFLLDKEDEGEFDFKSCIDSIAISPSGMIEIRYDVEGRLTLFSMHGQFHTKEMIKKEIYDLSLEKVERLAKSQLKCIRVPSYEKKRLYSVYAVEEIYIRNDQKTTIPFEIFDKIGPVLKIDQTMNWDEGIDESFTRQEVNSIEDLTVEQAFSREPSPDSYRIKEAEQEKCLKAVHYFLRQEYSNDTGKWIAKTLHRDKGYIHATLRLNHQTDFIFQRKINVIIDVNSYKVINYFDNKSFLDMFDSFQEPDETIIQKEEAYNKLKQYYELKPCYVYDVKQKQFVLCAKLDCQYGVDASSGEVVLLNDL